MTAPVVIKVVASTARVEAQPVQTVRLTPSDGARVVIVPAPGLQGPPGQPGDGTQVLNETPGGVRDGVNTAFTLAHAPQVGATAVYRNGLREAFGSGYTVAGSTITFTTAPLSSDVLAVDYLMEG